MKIEKITISNNVAKCREKGDIVLCNNNVILRIGNEDVLYYFDSNKIKKRTYGSFFPDPLWPHYIFNAQKKRNND